MIRRSTKTIGFLMIGLIIAGCSKSSSPTSSSSTPPQLNHPTFTGPVTASDSLGATTAQGIALEIGLESSLATSFMTGHPTQNGNTWSWTSSSNGVTETWTGTVESDGSYQWALTFNGKTDTANYSNWVWIKGTTSKSGSTGSFSVNNTNTTNPYLEFSWTTASDSTVTATVQNLDSTGTVQSTINLINNPDKSGELDEYEGTSVLVFKATWQSNGSGNWQQLDPSTGTWYYSSWS
ncbi:MAG: hypothetical protein M1339_03785 [Bacteroidetes bacterium]|nr:hypothetical protein [Bacteroidota bacterium]